jgi:TonB family protein
MLMTKFKSQIKVALSQAYLGLGLGLGLSLAMPAMAQLVPSVSANKAASAPGSDDAMERAKRQANNVMRWIKVQSNTAQRPTAPKPAEAAATPAPAAQSTPAAIIATRPARPAPAATPATAPEAATRPAEAAAPTAKTPEAPAGLTAPALPQVAPASIQDAKPSNPVEEPDDDLIAIAQPMPEFNRKTIESMSAEERVQVRFTILPSGAVTNVEILNSSNRLINRSTTEAVGKWRFQPIKVEQTVGVELAFKE